MMHNHTHKYYANNMMCMYRYAYVYNEKHKDSI